jgi:hypothetical protein
MKYAFGVSSGAVIYIPCFIKIGSTIQKLIGGIHRHTYREHGDRISLLSFFQNKESRLKQLPELQQCISLRTMYRFVEW